ncbi:MAG: multiheme c-type cytochrome [bacterium]
MRLLLLLTFMVGFGINAVLASSDYAGSEACGNCHPAKLESWAESGHHSSLVDVDGEAPLYPYNYHSGDPNVPNPPIVGDVPYAWSDIDYIIGGYYRSAVFVDHDGQIIAGGEDDLTAWNIWGTEWKPYHANDYAQDDCNQCHATGYEAGETAAWAEDGVGCEACHGPDS